MNDLTATGSVPGPGRIGRVAIGDLLKRAARRLPDRIALTDGARRVTFSEFERDANRFANYLVQRGLNPGEKISTICNNSVEFVKALFGIHRAGLVWVPINTMLGPADMDCILGHAEVRFALIDDNLHAQGERRAALEKRGMEMIAIDLTGKAKIGDLIVDLTPMYGSGAESVRVGDVVDVIGVQPASNGALIAGAVTSSKSGGVGGTGKAVTEAGVGGTGRSGVGGTGKVVTEAGVGGTGRSGVGGTGKLVTEAGVGGTGRSGVGGTGKLVTEAGVGGTGRSGVGGTGKSATALAGVGGTG